MRNRGAEENGTLPASYFFLLAQHVFILQIHARPVRVYPI